MTVSSRPSVFVSSQLKTPFFASSQLRTKLWGPRLDGAKPLIKIDWFWSKVISRRDARHVRLRVGEVSRVRAQ